MIIVLLADGFEEIEALTTVDMLRRAGLKVKTVGINNRVPTGSHGISVVCDAMPEDINLSKVMMVILPGGMPGTINLDNSSFTDKAIKAMIKNGGRIAAICAAPIILGRRGLLNGREATCYPGFEKDLQGAKILDRDVITDGNITTARGMGVAIEFAEELLSLLIGKSKTDDISSAICKSKTKMQDAGNNNKNAQNEDKKSEEDSIVHQSLDDFFASLMEDASDTCKDGDSANVTSTHFFTPDYSDYQAPSIELLSNDTPSDFNEDVQKEIQAVSDGIINVLDNFNVTASISGFDRGPRITRFEVVPAKGIKVSKVLNLLDDIALSIASGPIRMEAPIPGKSAIGIEVPNKKSSIVRLRNLLECDEFQNSKSKTLVAMGRDITGKPVFADIAKMPHMLIGGATGMGKSVLINSMICSLLIKARPDEVKLLLIDPKQVEFSLYRGIPHLFAPIISDPKMAVGALSWLTDEMERRYNIFSPLCVRNIDLYNDKISADPTLGEPMERIIVVIDELADLMLQVKDPIETLIMRLGQKARAAGIHLIIGTQRPTTSVITGLIKANIPARLACKTISSIDSKVLLDCSGAEKLIDKGDALYAPAGSPKPHRVQCAYVSDDEVEKITDSIRVSDDTKIYDPEILDMFSEELKKFPKFNRPYAKDDEEDEEENTDCNILHDKVFLEAVEFSINNSKVSTSLLQRKFSVGYGKAIKYLDNMEKLGIVGPQNGQRPRAIITTIEQWHQNLAVAGITLPSSIVKSEDEVAPTPRIKLRAEPTSNEERYVFENDKQFLDAVDAVLNAGIASTSLIQRTLSIGYGKAAKFIDIMEDIGIVDESVGSRPRRVIITRQEWEEKLERIKNQ